ncbi:hypothetical protein BJ912DRAFT_1092162 [Pholiota molesta]|nr:hypothetical protein BJ912DRAFT_1092162 [Pholiota molesta]
MFKNGAPPILLLADLSSRALMTRVVDGFFGTASAGGAGKNPLTRDELVVLSRQLLHTALPLYWDNVVNSLLGIHAQVQFVPADPLARHIPADMPSLLEAAVQTTRTPYDPAPRSAPRRQCVRTVMAPRNFPMAIKEFGVSKTVTLIPNSSNAERTD